MKKILITLIFPVFILTGCLNTLSVAIVEDMYTEALLEEDAQVAAYFSEEYLTENPIEPLADELAGHVRNAGGVKLLNAVEVTRNRLNPAIASELDETYSDEWYYIVNNADENSVMTWIVLKKSSQYEIVDGEELTTDDYNENVLN